MAVQLLSVYDPEDIVDSAISFFVSRGWSVDSQQRLSASFSCKAGPNGFSAMMLLLLAILPGLLYIFWPRGARAITIRARRTLRGSELIMTCSDVIAEDDAWRFRKWIEQNDSDAEDEATEDGGAP